MYLRCVGSGWLALLALGAVACGDDCNREGCDAVAVPSGSTVETGIAGSVASSSDVVENECQECPFAATTLGLWRTEELVTTADMRGEVDGRPPDQTLQADRSYSAALDPGYYVVCQSDEPCVAFQLREGDLITINVKLRYGPASFFVFDAQGKRQEEIFGFFTLPAPA